MNSRRFLVTISVAAALLASPMQAAATKDSEAAKYIENVGTQALDIISDKAASKEKKQAGLEKLFSANVDIPWVGKFVLGRFWRQATDEQKKIYLSNYESFLVQHYTSRFADYSGGTFEVTGTEDNGEGEYTVSMEMQAENRAEEPVLVDYRIRKSDSGYKIFDIIVEGVSLITTQRSEFAAVISNHDLDYLIKKLESKSLPIPVGK